MSNEATIKSDLARLDEMSDDDIDYSDIPPLRDEQLAAMRPLEEVLPTLSRQLQSTIELDEDVVSWFRRRARQSGLPGYRSLIHAALRDYIQQRESLDITSGS